MDLLTKNGVVYWFWRVRRNIFLDDVVTPEEKRWAEQLTAKVTDKATGKVVLINPLTMYDGDYLVPSHQDDLTL
jgi:hypothetical protein